MKYREIPNTNLKISEIGLGTWTIGGEYWTDGEPTGWGGEVNEDDVVAAINYAAQFNKLMPEPRSNKVMKRC